MGVGAAIGAIGSIGSAAINMQSATNAARIQSGTAIQVAGMQQAQFNQNQARSQPFVDAGTSATNFLSGLQNNPNAQLNALQNSPGYQFALDQGLKSTQSGYAARGLGTSGAALKGAAQYATGLAQQTYQQNVLAPAQFLSNLGESSAAGVSGLGAASAANAGAALIGGSNAAAAGTVASGQALGQGLSGLTSNAQLYSLLNGQQGNTSGITASEPTNANASYYNQNTGSSGLTA
jgi:hypothetical protein